MNFPSVAVVIAFHNGTTWIERALGSVKNQTFSASETIVVDDGSNSSESEKLAELQKKYSFTILTQANLGQSAARNQGVIASNSEYFCILDQDDYFLDNHIETLLNLVNFKDEKFGFSYGDLMRISEAGEILSESCVNVNSQHPHTELNVMLRNNMYILPSATLIRKSAFLDVGGFDTALQGYEDDDLFLRMFLNGYSNVFTQEVVSAWTINTKSTSFSEKMSRSRYLYFSKLLALFPLGTDPGDKVFADSLFPRFADKFAEDVIESALSLTAVFKERQGRLRSFRRLLKSTKGGRTKNTYLWVTFPLAGFTQGTLRGLLRAVLLFAPLFRAFRVRLLDEFSARYSLEKKASDD